MADGTHVAIEDIDAGDRVVAFDTGTSTWTTRTVTDQWGHLDEGTLTAVTLADGSSVTSTAEHLYWSVDAGDDRWGWVEAQYLDDGDYLATPDGNVEVANIVTTVGSPEWVWELSVETDHNFTVHTGTVDVVVHNADCSLSLNSSNHARSVRDAPATSKAGEARGALDAANRAGVLDGDLRIQVHHIVPTQVLRGVRPAGISDSVAQALETAVERIEASGFLDTPLPGRLETQSGNNRYENLIPMPSDRAQLNDLRAANSIDWEGGIHSGNHPASYFEGLSQRLSRVDEGASAEDVASVLDWISDDIRSGVLNPSNG